MNDDINPDHLVLFVEEAEELISQWEASLLELARNPSIETVKELYRPAHTLKGTSAALGLTAFSKFVHHIEDLLRILQKGTLNLETEVIGFLFELQEILARWIAQLRENPKYSPSIEKTNNTLTNYLRRSEAKTKTSSVEDNPKLGEILVSQGLVFRGQN